MCVLLDVCKIYQHNYLPSSCSITILPSITSISSVSPDSSTTGVCFAVLQRIDTLPSWSGSLLTSSKCHQQPFGFRRMRYRPFLSPCHKPSSSISLLTATPGLRTTSWSTLGRGSGRPVVSPHTLPCLESRTTDPVATSITCRFPLVDEGSRMQGLLPALRPSSDSGWKGPQGLRKRCCPLVCMEITSEPVLVTVTCSRVRLQSLLSEVPALRGLSRRIRVSIVGGHIKFSTAVKKAKPPCGLLTILQVSVVRQANEREVLSVLDEGA